MVWAWIAIFVIMIIVELATPTALVSIWFALGSLVSLILAFFDVNVWVQLIVFIVASALSLVLLRPLAARHTKDHIVATNYDAVVGKTAIVTEEISEHKWGHVEVQGVDWSAKTQDGSTIEKGTQVVVLSVEGVKLIVKKQED